VKNEPIVIHGDGEQTRDFIYVKDVAAANVFFATQSPATGVFNVGYGHGSRSTRWLRPFCQSAGSSSVVQYAQTTGRRETLAGGRGKAARRRFPAAGKFPRRIECHRRVFPKTNKC